MKSNDIKIWPVLALIFLIGGCAAPSRITVRVLKPAAVDLPGVNQIAVVDFIGPDRSGSHIATRMQSMLMQSNRFSILERERINRILDEQNLGMSGIVDDETAVEVGKILGVDAMIFGEVTRYDVPEDQKIDHKVKEQRFTGKYRDVTKKNKKTGKETIEKEKIYEEVWVDRHYWIRQGTVEINFRVVDVKTGKLLAAHSDSKSYDSQKEKRSFWQTRANEQAALKPKGEILNDLSAEIAEDFVKMIAPYYIDEMRFIEPGRGQIDIGRSFAQNGLWPEAMRAWQQAMQEMPGESAAYYNYGLACEVKGILEEAEQYYLKALGMAQKDLYMQALSRVRQTRNEQIRLQNQLEEH